MRWCCAGRETQSHGRDQTTSKTNSILERKSSIRDDNFYDSRKRQALLILQDSLKLSFYLADYKNLALRQC